MPEGKLKRWVNVFVQERNKRFGRLFLMLTVALALTMAGCVSKQRSGRTRVPPPPGATSGSNPASGATSANGTSSSASSPVRNIIGDSVFGQLPGLLSSSPTTTGTLPHQGALAPEAIRKVSTKGMSLTDAVGVAISRHPDIGRAEAVVAQSASEVAIAKSAWYPTIEYGVRPGYGSSFGDSGSKSGMLGTASANQLIYDFGRTPSAVSAADATLTRQRHLFDNTVEVVAYTAAQHFVDLSASQAMMAAADKQYESLRKTRDMIADRVKAGLSDASDLNHADVSLQSAVANQLKAKTQFDVAAGELAEVLGIRPVSVADMMVTSVLVSKLAGGDKSIERTPAVLAAKSAVAAAEAKVSQVRAERYPSISLSASKSYSTGGKNANDSTWVGLSVGGNMSLGNRAGYRVVSAEAERNAAMKEYENQQLTTRSALTSAETESTGAVARAKAYDQMMSLSRSSRDLYWQEYTLNKRPLTEMLNAERDIYAAEVERITAEADSLIAKIKAQVATGSFVKRLRDNEGKKR